MLEDRFRIREGAVCGMDRDEFNKTAIRLFTIESNGEDKITIKCGEFTYL